MLLVRNPLGQDPADVIDDTAADRIGNRIRKIREARNMPMADLANQIGISSDMLQKYENGQRKPKIERLKQIATVLGVSSLALTDPVSTAPITTMFMFFELEYKYGLSFHEINGSFVMDITGNCAEEMNDYFHKWCEYKMSIGTRMNNASEEEKTKLIQKYYDWEWSFPDALAWKPSHEEKLQEKEALEKRLKELNDDLASNSYY